jgi:hypothetical protein
MKLPNLFVTNFFRLFSDSNAGQKALNKIFTTLLFVTTMGIEIYTLIRTDCSYALEFVITNFTFIAASLGISLFGGVIKRNNSVYKLKMVTAAVMVTVVIVNTNNIKMKYIE